MKAIIFNPYWDTLGGGERYTASFVQLLLSNNWQVDIYWSKNIASEIFHRFGVDIKDAKYVNTKSAAGYDLAFYVSDGSLPTSLAHKTLIHLQYPFKNIGGHSLPNLIKSRFYSFVVNSQFTKSFIDEEFLVNSHVIYPPIDTSAFISGKKSDTILYVGRFSNLTQSKGQKYLIESFTKISSQIPFWQLILAGGTSVGASESEMSELKKLSASLPIEIITNPSLVELKKLYAQAKIFWSASGFGYSDLKDPLKVEHFGISLVEAMSAGCVPIVTNLGGHKEIIADTEDGFLWDTPEQLQSLTLQLIKEPGILNKISKQAISKSKIFDISHFNDNFLKLI